MSAKFLVTGLNGLIGWHVFKEAERTFPSWGTYRRRHPDLTKENASRIDFFEAGQLLNLLNEFQPHYLVHAWAMCDLDLCEDFPEKAYRTNVEGTECILDAAEAYGRLKKFVYISTDHVFDGEEGGYDEKAQPVPKHVYGKTKLQAERLVQKSHLNSLIIRPGLVIGESLQGNKGPRDYLFRRIQAGKPTHYFTDEWRSPIPALEFARRVIERSTQDQVGICHIAGAQKTSRYDLAKSLVREHGMTCGNVLPRLRAEDRWAHIRPKDLSLHTLYP